MQYPNLEVRKSKNGKGVFMLHAIKKGDVVMEWNPENRSLTKEEVVVLSDLERTYVAVVDGAHILLAEPGRYVNHSCSPNIQNVSGVDYALRDIEPGEEITGDYQGGGTGAAFDCLCAEAECRGKVTPTPV